MYGGSVISCSTQERAYVSIEPHPSLLLEYFKAFIDFALSDDRYGYIIRQYLVWKADQIG